MGFAKINERVRDCLPRLFPRDIERSQMLGAGGAGEGEVDGNAPGTTPVSTVDLSLKKGEKIKISIGGGKVHVVCLVCEALISSRAQSLPAEVKKACSGGCPKSETTLRHYSPSWNADVSCISLLRAVLATQVLIQR